MIPIEIRRTMNLKPKDALEIYVESDKLIFSTYKPGCMFCGEMSETFEFEGRTICKNCLNKMKKQK